MAETEDCRLVTSAVPRASLAFAVVSLYYAGMSAIQEAVGEVIRARDAVRSLVATAAASGDYDGVGEIVEIARGLELLLQRSEQVTARSERDESGPGRPPRKRAGGKARAARRASSSTKKRRTVRKGASPARPEFFRRGEDLVKVASSRTGGQTYEHKAPAAVLDGLLAVLAGVGDEERLVQMDTILPALAESMGSEVPSYQAYLCLAWLRDSNLVVQHGRRGYTVVKPHSLRDHASRLFASLASKA